MEVLDVVPTPVTMIEREATYNQQMTQVKEIGVALHNQAETLIRCSMLTEEWTEFLDNYGVDEKSFAAGVEFCRDELIKALGLGGDDSAT